MNSSNNKGIMIFIAVILLGILGVMVVQGGFVDRRSGVEKAADSVGEAVEEIGDEIDDHTTAK